MVLKEFQKLSTEITDKIDTTRKGKHDIHTTFVHIVEEIGEISRELYGSAIGRSELDIKNLGGEIIDTYILLAKLASLYDIDLEKAFYSKIDTLKNRFPNVL